MADEQKITVAKEVYEYMDPRVDLLASGAVTAEDFSRMIKPDDPFELRGNTVVEMSVEAAEKRLKEYFQLNVANLKSTAGLNGPRVWDFRDKVLAVFPELSPLIKNTADEIEKEQCKGCALNRKMTPILTEIVKLCEADHRDVSKLADVFGEFSMQFLTGVKVVSEADIGVPGNYKKRAVPKRTPAAAQPHAPEPAADTVSTAPPFDAESPAGVPRQGCALCCRKHLGQAVILLKECLQGYSPDEGFLHMSYALGHLAEAADEIVANNTGLAARIRAVRNSLMSAED
jgi:hypothetical protein